MDLQALRSTSESIKMYLDNPVTKEPMDKEGDPVLYIRFINSKEVKAIQRDAKNKLYQKLTKRASISAESEERSQYATVAACITGWENITLNGEDFPYSPENAKKLVMDDGFNWLFEQVLLEASDEKNFIRGA